MTYIYKYHIYRYILYYIFIYYNITHVINTKSICCGATWSAFEGGHWWPLWPESEALRALQRAAQDGGIGLGLVSSFFWALLA